MKLVAKFAAGVVDTGGKFATGVVDTCPFNGNLAVNRKILIRRSALGGMIFCKTNKYCKLVIFKYVRTNGSVKNLQYIIILRVLKLQETAFAKVIFHILTMHSCTMHTLHSHALKWYVFCYLAFIVIGQRYVQEVQKCLVIENFLS